LECRRLDAERLRYDVLEKQMFTVKTKLAETTEELHQQTQASCLYNKSSSSQSIELQAQTRTLESLEEQKQLYLNAIQDRKQLESKSRRALIEFYYSCFLFQVER
jgi:hypothetical protein